MASRTNNFSPVAAEALAADLCANQRAIRCSCGPIRLHNHLRPEILVAAVEVLEAAGFQVMMPTPSLCCDMAGSFGFEASSL